MKGRDLLFYSSNSLKLTCINVSNDHVLFQIIEHSGDYIYFIQFYRWIKDILFVLGSVILNLLALFIFNVVWMYGTKSGSQLYLISFQKFIPCEPWWYQFGQRLNYVEKIQIGHQKISHITNWMLYSYEHGNGILTEQKLQHIIFFFCHVTITNFVMFYFDNAVIIWKKKKCKVEI